MTKATDILHKRPFSHSWRYAHQYDPFKNSQRHRTPTTAKACDFSPSDTKQGNHTSHTAKTPRNGLFGENRRHKAQNGNRRQGNQTPTPANRHQMRFDTQNKPDPASFYARYGITLKGKQTNVRCCFHGDKTPSLSINSVTGAFYCFGCGVCGGDVIDFYQRYHGCDFATACQEMNLAY